MSELYCVAHIFETLWNNNIFIDNNHQETEAYLEPMMEAYLEPMMEAYLEPMMDL